MNQRPAFDASERRRSAAGRILVLSYVSPLDPWGAPKRTLALIDALRRHAPVDVAHLVPAIDGDADRSVQVVEDPRFRLYQLRVPFGSFAEGPKLDLPSRRITAWLNERIDMSAYALIVSRYVKPALKLELPAGVPVLVDFDDAVYQPAWRSFKTVRNWVGGIGRVLHDRLLTRARLMSVRRRAMHFLFCGERERRAFPFLRSSVAPNIAPLPAGPVPARPIDGQRLLFVGLLEYAPNQEAIGWFLRNVWPRVIAAVPAARLSIIGRGPDTLLDALRACPGVDVHGFVPDLAPHYAAAAACIAPIRSGAGSAIKVLEACAYRRLAITTPGVVQGHGDAFRPGHNILVGASDEEFARHCVFALTQPEAAAVIAARGEALVDQHYSRARFDRAVDAAIAELGFASAVADSPSAVAREPQPVPSR